VSRQAPPALASRALARRLLAWLYTGPLGHLWSTVADIVSLWTEWAAATARERMRERRAGYSKR
jgi:hypothetical protein